MKLEPFPWFEGYLINMDELYTELTLEKCNNTRFSETGKTLRNYEDMFKEDSESSLKGKIIKTKEKKKILSRGETAKQ